jgi:hypothetical protein
MSLTKFKPGDTVRVLCTEESFAYAWKTGFRYTSKADGSKLYEMFFALRDEAFTAQIESGVTHAYCINIGHLRKGRENWPTSEHSKNEVVFIPEGCLERVFGLQESEYLVKQEIGL